MPDPLTGTPKAPARAVDRILDALGLCPHCDGPRRLIRIGGDDRPIEVCDRCHVAWLGGTYAGRRLVRLGSEIPAPTSGRAAGR